MEYARMRLIADELSTRPEAWAVEISGGEIIMITSPAKRHEFISFQIADQLNDQLRGTTPRVIAQSGAEIEDPRGAAALRRPDITILPMDVLDEDGDTVDPADVTAVVEVVPRSNPENDYEGKTRDYAVMGIPYYLLVDPRKGTGLVLSQPRSTPEGQRYAARVEFLFGETVQVGEWHVDTEGFPLYGAPGAGSR
ncbi:Uma2 family endonuclease [Streptomyces sp. H39-C1]|uniref:Uma2 family endonuclease n=1 Tax=Streptomyces sp. H39-C1 TaxID=3004355 RepID=UPI0022AF30CE|nr:Uma2 family endonuclease [Streptomyces sp. H39-C1]MCZ4096481.1 Uma2 family endonuclease [Streptomyces sp. H39-C1]